MPGRTSNHQIIIRFYKLIIDYEKNSV